MERWDEEEGRGGIIFPQKPRAESCFAEGKKLFQFFAVLRFICKISYEDEFLLLMFSNLLNKNRIPIMNK